MILRGENFESTVADINGMVDTVGSEMGGIDAVGNNGDLGYGQGIEL